MSVLSKAFREVFIPEVVEQYDAFEKDSLIMPDPIQWIAENYYVYDTRQLFEFHPPIETALEEALYREEDGTWAYDLVLWSWIKKSAKSTVIAAVVHYIASNKPHARIALMGNDLRQATSRVGTYLRECIKIAQHKEHDDFVTGIHVPKLRSGDIIYPNGSIVEMLPIDPQGEAGGNHDMIVFSELWGWRHQAHQDMWAEMTISPTRFGHAQRWIDTYAGYRGQSVILEELHDEIVKEENRLDADEVEIYASGGQFAVWQTKPCLPWQTAEYYASEAKTLTAAQYARMHRNQWSDSSEMFISPAMWEQCRRDLPAPPDHVKWVFAVDAGVSNDLFAIVGVYRQDVRIDGKIIRGIRVGYCRTWKAKPGEKLDFAEPKAELRRIMTAYPVVEIAYDPYQLHSMMGELQRESRVFMKEFPQGKDRNIADKQLYDLILEERLLHDGNAVLTEHVLNADADINKQENKLRLIKRQEKLKIDAAVALSMAAYRAHYLNIGIVW